MLIGQPIDPKCVHPSAPHCQRSSAAGRQARGSVRQAGVAAMTCLVDVAAIAARSRQAEQLRQCSQTLRLAAAAHGGQALA